MVLCHKSAKQYETQRNLKEQNRFTQTYANKVNSHIKATMAQKYPKKKKHQVNTKN